MSVAARAFPSDSSEPFEVPEQIRRIQAQTDWAAALPAHAGTWRWEVQQVIKRAADVVLAAGGLVVLAPLLAVIALLVRMTSPGPVLYEWRVLGRHARPFTGYKFRTMVAEADALKAHFMAHNEMSGVVFKMRDDPRVTRLGRWLRKYSIDELPQLWSVLKGDMSLVGPRPPAPEEFVQFEPWQRLKLSVTPGITCLWQVSGRSEIRELATWVRLDLQYIRTWSLWQDVKILFRTVPAVLRARGAY